MGADSPPKPVLLKWVEWHAGHIKDPVGRLRFLKTVAPQIEPQSRRLRIAWRFWPVAVALLASSFFIVRARLHVEPLPTMVRRVRVPVLQKEGLPSVWRVEGGKDFETYSNGLRIDNHYAVSHHPRSYRAFPVERPEEAATEPRNQPVGIVFHTTESHQAPFEAGNNRELRQAGESILDYVSRHHAYNFLIDRFGRVYRIVAESDAADHAGYSVWADADWLYVNLNESFLGVSFEARTEPGQEESAVTPAQIRSAGMLTEMLRSRYAIPASNCVTHAQVSVNPSNMRIGYHTDWASSFPFEQLGLPDNYAQPSAAVLKFGFECDPTFVSLAGAKLYAGVQLAEERLREDAAERGLPLATYRRTLQRLYRARFHRATSGGVEGTE